MKFVFSLIMGLFISLSIFAQDTIVVQTFDFSSDSRDAVFEFPPKQQYRKIIMEYGMRCHDLVVGNGQDGCREWDYSCNTIIYDSSRVDSVLVDDGQGGLMYETSSPVRYELLSFVTPYGNGLDLGPEGVMWQFDLTDFAPVLHGKKRLALIGGGQFQEEMNIVFKFITGVPERDVIDIRPIWPLSLGTNVNHIADDRVYEPREVQVGQDVDAVKLRSVVTGHGQNGEFTSFRHVLKVDGDTEYRYNVWLDCSNIPVFPQGGTWLLNRAGWCPGDPSQLNEFYVAEDKLATGSFTVDYDIPNIRGLAEARYIINNQMVMYGPMNHTTDASIEAVVRPSDRIEFGRTNPSCFEPQFVIQNRGTAPLTSLDIEYGVRGGDKKMFTWTGNLVNGEVDTVTVALGSEEFISVRGVGQFEVNILNQDDQMDNNSYVQTFDPTPVFEGKNIQILLTTNKIASDNELTLVNEQNEVVLEYTDLMASRAYFEEVVLTNGCYRMKLTDKSGDGLYFWFYERNGANFGRGGLAFYVDNEEIEDFEPEFGRLLQYEFIIGKATSTSNQDIGRIKIYPNPTTDRVVIETKDYPYSSVLTVVDAYGNVLKIEKISAGNVHSDIDLSTLPAGVYHLHWQVGDRIVSEKIVKQ